MDMDPNEWQRALELSDEDIPVAIISEGTWWRDERTTLRLGHLEDVRELKFPDMFFGRWHGKPIVYCCAYGAPRAVEVAHLFGSLGARLAVQIGTCGGLQSGLRPGDIVVPSEAVCREGIAQVYGAADRTHADPQQRERARRRLEELGHSVHDGVHLTWYSIFAQSGAMVEEWAEAGYLSVDMETATTFAVAEHFGMASVSMLVVWDDLLGGRSFLDPLDPVEQKRLDEGNTTIFDVALDLIDGL